MPAGKNVLVVIATLLLFSVTTATAQGFGQNKVQYRDFDWHFLQSEHFNVYFYPGAYEIAAFTANVAESSYVVIKNDFQYELKQRVSIILYRSHNDFQQTNVINSYLSDGVGGVTELYKNRVVLPFEGSFSQLRHVIHHELVHAVMNDMLYGGSIQSLVSGQVTPVPLWFAEGLAEYSSLRWDTRTDMIVRDATITGYLPPITYLDYFLAYQGGASVFRYISEKYGNEKIGEILNKLKGSFRFDAVIKSALGVELEELSENWQKEMRREYWPDIANRKETKEIARALTDHTETRNYLNISPTLSPNGDKLVFLSDRDGKRSIWLMDILENKITRRLIKGQTSVDFEQLKWLSPGMGWSPDGSKITFAAKAGDQDALYVYDLDSDDYEQFKFGLDGIFSSTWSPVSNEIAFIGNKNGESDIYIYSLDSKELKNITQDRFSDSYPAWSNDGERIAFVSERGSYIDGDPGDDFQMYEHDYDNTDIYIIDKDGSNLVRVTDTDDRESDPTFSPDNSKLMFVSDRTGIYNIYIRNLETGEEYPVTNVLTGVFQLSIDKDGKTLAFSSFFEGGWDIFTIKNPFEMEAVEVENTVFYDKLKENGEEAYLASRNSYETEEDTSKQVVKLPQVSNYSNYVFADLENRTRKEKVEVKLEEDDYKRDDGNFRVRNYKVKFSPDIINGAAQYNTLWGFQGFTQIAYSDVLGNHKIFLGTNLVFDLRNSYIEGQYWYLPKRIDYGMSLFHYANTYLSSRYGLLRFRNYGFSSIASRPFNKFTRIDLSLNVLNASLEYLEIGVPDQKVRSIVPSIQLVHDTAEWWYTGPNAGFRGAVSLTTSPKYTSQSLEFTTFKTDLRKYFKLSRYYSLAFRVAGGVSGGANPQQFYLGGVSNWLNRDFRDGVRIGSIKDVYFSEFVTPLRGARYYERVGSKYVLLNSEFRFPLIPYIELGFPPLRFGNIQGLLFTDIGSAWDDNSTFRGVDKDVFGNHYFDDLVMGYGIGARIFFLFLIKYDIAWDYDLQSSSKPKHYISIGIDF